MPRIGQDGGVGRVDRGVGVYADLLPDRGIRSGYRVGDEPAAAVGDYGGASGDVYDGGDSGDDPDDGYGRRRECADL